MRPDLEKMWSGAPDDPEPQPVHGIAQLLRGDALWQTVQHLPFKPGREAAARRLLRQLANRLHRERLSNHLLWLYQGKGIYGLQALHHLRLRLQRHQPPLETDTPFIDAHTWRRWLHDWPDAWNLERQAPKLAEFTERLNQKLSPQDWLRRPQDVKQLVDKNGIEGGWRLLLRHGTAILRPLDHSATQVIGDVRRLMAPVLVQTRMGAGQLFPPWFLRAFIRLREAADAPLLGMAGWRLLPPSLLREAGQRARRATTPAARQRLLADTSVLLACPCQPLLEDAFKSGDWAAALRLARQIASESHPDAALHGLRFVPLTTPDALVEEGRAQHHCIGNGGYHEDLGRADVRVLSIRLPSGQRLSTAMVRYDCNHGWRVMAHHAMHNRRPSETVSLALSAYLRTVPAPPQPES